MTGGNIRVSPLWLSVTLAVRWEVCPEHSQPGLTLATAAHSQRAPKPKLVDWCFWCRNTPVVETQEDNLSQTTTNAPSLDACSLQRGCAASGHEMAPAQSLPSSLHCCLGQTWDPASGGALVSAMDYGVLGTQLCGAFAQLFMMLQAKCTRGKK